VSLRSGRAAAPRLRRSLDAEPASTYFKFVGKFFSWWLLAAALALGTGAAAPPARSVEPRELRLLVLADEEYRTLPAWRQRLASLVAAASADFEQRFGLRFIIARYEEWASDDSISSMSGLMGKLEALSSKGDHQILLAVTAQGNLGDSWSGLVLFKEAVVLLRRGRDRGRELRALEHELAHLFGAVHVDDRTALMDWLGRGQAFDPLNSELIRLNRERRFGTLGFPLLPEAVEKSLPVVERICGLLPESAGRTESAVGSAGANLSEGGLADAWLMLAHLRLEKKDYAGVEAACREAVRLNPGSVEARNLLGVSFRRRGENDRAIEIYSGILKEEPENTRVLYNLGIALAKKGDLAAALDRYLEALRLRPNFAEAWCNLGDVLLKQDKLDQAEKALLKALEIEPGYGLARSNLAEVLLARGETDTALAECRKALALEDDNPNILNTYGRILHKKGDWGAAVRALEEAVAIDPGHARAWLNLGNIMLERKEPAAARSRFEKALDNEPALLPAREGLGMSYLLEGRAQEALNEFKKAAELGAASASFHVNVAGAYIRLREHELALEECRIALRLDPTLASARNNLGLALLLAGRPEEARLEFEKGLESEPGNTEILDNYGQLLLAQADFKKAAEVIARLVALDPANAAAHNNLAYALFRLGDYEACWSHLEKARSLGLKVPPDFVEAVRARLKKRVGTAAPQTRPELFPLSTAWAIS